MEQLKECPFCRSNGEIHNVGFGGNGHEYYPKCSNENCILNNIQEQDEQGGVNITYYAKQEAIDAWNTRPLEDALQSELGTLKQSVKDAVKEIDVLFDEEARYDLRDMVLNILRSHGLLKEG